MINKNLENFWSDIKDPKVDLKFLNDFLRNGIGLGLAWAIGFFMIENTPGQIAKYSAYAIPFIVIILLILNIIQFMLGVDKIFGISAKFEADIFTKCLSMISGLIIGSTSYIALIMVFAGNLQVVLQKLV